MTRAGSHSLHEQIVRTCDPQLALALTGSHRLSPASLYEHCLLLSPAPTSIHFLPSHIITVKISNSATSKVSASYWNDKSDARIRQLGGHQNGAGRGLQEHVVLVGRWSCEPPSTSLLCNVCRGRLALDVRIVQVCILYIYAHACTSFRLSPPPTWFASSGMPVNLEGHLPTVLVVYFDTVPTLGLVYCSSGHTLCRLYAQTCSMHTIHTHTHAYKQQLKERG